MTLGDLINALAGQQGWTTTKEGPRFTLAVPQGAERHQVVAVSEFTDNGEAMVRYTTRIGKATGLEGPRLRAALELNSRLPHGCLAVEGDHLVLTETRPLGTTTPETSGIAIRYIARQADSYEKLIFGTDIH
jgi:hypothetical protein